MVDPCQAYFVVWSKHYDKYQLLSEKHDVHCITILCVQQRFSQKIFLFDYQLLMYIYMCVQWFVEPWNPSKKLWICTNTWQKANL